jgi:hypothetical protein
MKEIETTCTFHSMTLLSFEQVKSILSSGDHATNETDSSCPHSEYTRRDVSTSQMIAVPSLLADARNLPECEYATYQTWSVCSARMLTVSHGKSDLYQGQRYFDFTFVNNNKTNLSHLWSQNNVAFSEPSPLGMWYVQRLRWYARDCSRSVSSRRGGSTNADGMMSLMKRYF